MALLQPWLAEPHSCGAVAANHGVGSNVGWLTKWGSSPIERWQDQGRICHMYLSYFLLYIMVGVIAVAMGKSRENRCEVVGQGQ